MEVAETLGRFPGVSEVAVYGVHVPGHDGRAGCAAVHLDANQAPTPEFFASFLHYAKEKLPKYAVPVFVRLLRQVNPMHNNKQNKIPLKKDEINLDAIYGPDIDASEARDEGRDIVYWWPSALAHPNPTVYDETYVMFARADWEALKGQTWISKL